MKVGREGNDEGMTCIVGRFYLESALAARKVDAATAIEM